MVLTLPPSLKSWIVASSKYPTSLRHFSIVIVSFTLSAGYLARIRSYDSWAIKSLFASIKSAASSVLLLIVTPDGLRTSAEAVNFLNPLGLILALNWLLEPAVTGASLTFNSSSFLAPIR